MHSGRCSELNPSGFRKLTKFLLFAFTFLLSSALRFLTTTSTHRVISIHITRTRFVVMGIGVGVLVILSNVLELI